MDKDAERQQIENELAVLESYLTHPVSREILQESREREDAIVNAVCQNDIVDIASFFAHFRSIGELAGLRRARVLMEGQVEELKAKLKEIQ